MGSFRGKRFKRFGNHYALIADNGVNTGINVYQYNSGAKANFIVEVIGLKPTEKNTFIVNGCGPEARDLAISMASEMVMRYGRLDGYKRWNHLTGGE